MTRSVPSYAARVAHRGPSLLRQPLVLALITALVAVIYGVGLASSLQLLWLIAVPAALALLVLAFVRPDLVAIIVLAITWGYMSEIANKYHGIPSISKPIVVLLVVVLMFRFLFVRRERLVFDRIILWMLVFFVVICSGLIYARYPDQTMLMVIDFAKDISLVWVLINFVVSVKNLERGVWLLLGIGAVLGALAFYQEITGSHDRNFGGLARSQIAHISDDFANRPRAGGPMGEPNAFGQQLLVLVPLGLWGIMRGRSRLARSFAVFATISCIAGVVLSFSRSSYVSLGLALILFMVYKKLDFRYILLLILMTVTLYLFAPPEFQSRFSTLENLLPGREGVYSEGSFLRRSVEMRMALNMFADYPIAGVGARNFRMLYPAYIRDDGSPVPLEQRDAHSFYLEIAAEHGLLGLIPFCVILFLTWRRMSRTRQVALEAGDARLVDLSIALQSGFAGYLLSATFLHGVYSRFLWLQVAIAIILWRAAKGKMRQGE